MVHIKIPKNSEKISGETLTDNEREFLAEILPKGWKVFKTSLGFKDVWILTVKQKHKKFSKLQDLGDYALNKIAKNEEESNQKIITSEEQVTGETVTETEKEFLTRILPKDWKVFKESQGLKDAWILTVLGKSKSFSKLLDLADFILYKVAENKLLSQNETVAGETVTEDEREFLTDHLPKGWKVMKLPMQDPWMLLKSGEKRTERFSSFEDLFEYISNNGVCVDETEEKQDVDSSKFTPEEEAFLENVLPKGWKAIKARLGTKIVSILISPEGKRFETLQQAHEYIEEEKQKKVSKKEQLLKELFDAEQTPWALQENAKLRRKLMAQKRSFKNLLQKTLEKNHVLNASQEQTSINYQKYLSKKKRNLKRAKGL